MSEPKGHTERSVIVSQSGTQLVPYFYILTLCVYILVKTIRLLQTYQQRSLTNIFIYYIDYFYTRANWLKLIHLVSAHILMYNPNTGGYQLNGDTIDNSAYR